MTTLPTGAVYHQLANKCHSHTVEMSIFTYSKDSERIPSWGNFVFKNNMGQILYDIEYDLNIMPINTGKVLTKTN